MNERKTEPEPSAKGKYEPAQITFTRFEKSDLLLSADFELKESEWETFSFEFIF